LTNHLVRRTTDDAALRAKVDEAMNVYEDYMRNNPEKASGPAPTNGENEANEESA